jgi:hypothetical protein
MFTDPPNDEGRKPMSYTLGQAAKATGMSRSSILRAVNSGKVSATKDVVKGSWMIEPAELHRVYPMVKAEQSENDEMTSHAHGLDELRQVWDRERVQLERTIEDLRGRLDAADEERRATLQRLTALLTDQHQETSKRRGWFARLGR